MLFISIGLIIPTAILLVIVLMSIPNVNMIDVIYYSAGANIAFFMNRLIFRFSTGSVNEIYVFQIIHRVIKFDNLRYHVPNKLVLIIYGFIGGIAFFWLPIVIGYFIYINITLSITLIVFHGHLP